MRDHCAYNVTRECFLALEVAVEDIQTTKRRDLPAILKQNNGEGLWIVPFRGIPATGLAISLDLVYLDEECHVMHVDDSFRTSRELSTPTRAATALVLPRHSIYSSQTQDGDQLIICTIEEMVQRLEDLSNSGGHAGASHNAVLLMETPLWKGNDGFSESKNCSEDARSGSSGAPKEDLAKVDKVHFTPRISWWKRLWFSDPRKAVREPVHNLAAYYWNGARPTPQTIRDINLKGMYVETDERWFPGTLVLMTLQRTDPGDETAERSIHVYTRAVRWGKDGVGLQFALPDVEDLPEGLKSPVQTVNRKELAKFLEGIRRGRRTDPAGRLSPGDFAERNPSLWEGIRARFTRTVPAEKESEDINIDEPGRKP
jgi:hypothetical protein